MNCFMVLCNLELLNVCILQIIMFLLAYIISASCYTGLIFIMLV